MITKENILQLVKILEKVKPKTFICEILAGKYPVLSKEDNLYDFFKFYCIQIDKERTLALARLYVEKSKNKSNSKLLLLRVKNLYYAVVRNLEECKNVYQKIKETENITKPILSESRIQLAITASTLEVYDLAYELYIENLNEWKEDESKAANESLTRTYCFLMALYSNLKIESKVLEYSRKLEQILPKIKDNKDVYLQSIMLYTKIKFTHKLISASEALQVLSEIENRLALGNFTFKLYKIEFLAANNEFEQIFSLAKEVLNEEKKVPSNIYISTLYLYLSFLNKYANENEFLNSFDAYFDLLNKKENISKTSLSLLQSKIETLEEKDQIDDLLASYKTYVEWQKIVLDKHHKLKWKIGEARLKIKAKRQELKELKEKAASKEKINRVLIEKNENLESFSSSTAHDLKSPIKTISMFIGLLKNSLTLNTEELEMFLYIESSSKRLNTLIDDLLSFANSGNFANTKSCIVNLNAVIKKIKTDLKAIIDDQKAKIEIKETLPKIEINPTAITVLIQNLINNAIKFKAKNRLPEIEISHKLIDGEIKIVVKDNGNGISKNDLNKIFEPFARSEKVKNIEGSGLGLSTCIKIANSYNGTIQVKTKEGIGTSFIISLPKNLHVSS